MGCGLRQVEFAIWGWGLAEGFGALVLRLLGR